MEASKSQLNPYATAYIPLSQRQPQLTHNKTISEKSTENFGILTEKIITGTMKPVDGASQYQLPDDISLDFHIPEEDELFDPDDFLPPGHEYESFRMKGGMDKSQGFERDSQWLEVLLARFPGFSEECLIDVYSANSGHMPSTIDMLSQLEYWLAEGVKKTEIMRNVRGREMGILKLVDLFH
ncbi:polyadenylate-binding protein-interacting protein 6 isoform X2 [Amborella trichopoda]|uniref:polyadenylate-binding protein-interacting protein 6 isoform X2 n=1 Tax=Amborella trichopoda TaxID=13333 RepID=UPI0009BD69EE|nr:polyadenylate-binding protein-interacting protein 6 isoform X2 [Amborella trichopoda]|eukprot:XP_020522875.1 polyadenylate-binding protein-interacting protein 6 isoform X2 [Amborella trichopoda]